MLKIIGFSFLIISFLLSCRGVKSLPRDYAARQERKRPVLAIFMDGTMDKPHGKKHMNTHVKKIHSSIFDSIGSLYIEGVGAGFVVKDAKYAGTTKERVMRAYRFLSENYKTGDSICLFGFSRGANQCRILSSLIYCIGIIDMNIIQESDRQELLLDLYKLYDTTAVSNKKINLAGFLNSKGLRHSEHYDTSGTTMIELMGLWDTVEALTIGDSLEIITPIPLHLNQLYNVKKLFHATSLDDNRAFNYSPILATHKEVSMHPGQDINSIVEEVWFNGSHKDVGGGVRSRKRDQLSGISLKWMSSRVRAYHIYKDPAIVYNLLGKANDMRDGKFLKKFSPGDTLRGINKYWGSMNVNWNNHRIKVHQSVIDRLAEGEVPEFKRKKEDGSDRSDWFEWEPFKHCFTKTVIHEKTVWIFKKDCPCIEVVNDCGTTN